MKNSLKMTGGLAALVLALGACASTPDANPRLLAAEASLQQAKSNPATLQSSQATLEKADAALMSAREFYERGKDDDYMHALRMGEGYVDLAMTRGAQVESEADIKRLNLASAEMVANARSRELAAAQAATAEAEYRADQSESLAAGAVAETAAANAARLAAEAKAAALSAELDSYEQKQTDLGMTLILRDLNFASDSAVLTTGAQGRLAPLASYMAKQPESRIQIAGHTDSQGDDAYNQALSARRAESVGAYLISTGVNANRIQTVGHGESMPLSPNDTAAGRAINRRVEITILD